MCGDGEEIKRLFYMSPTRKGMCGTNGFMLLCSRFYCDMYRLYLKDKAGGGGAAGFPHSALSFCQCGFAE